MLVKISMLHNFTIETWCYRLQHFLNRQGAEQAKLLKWDNKKGRWISDKDYNNSKTFEDMVRENEKRAKDLLRPGRSPLRTRLFESQTKERRHIRLTQSKRLLTLIWA